MRANKALRSAIAQALQGAQPLDDPVPFRFPASVRRHYERLRRFPDGIEGEQIYQKRGLG